jgi:Ca-activated chloride channel family protein
MSSAEDLAAPFAPVSLHFVSNAIALLADRLIVAQIREKQQAKNAGQTAALLEQHRPNVFQMNVANIMPGDDVRVELRYTELLTLRNGRYQFVFPTVVGPRCNSLQGAAA